MRRPVRWILGVVLTVLALAGLGVWRAHSIANETIARHLDAFRAALPRLRATSHPRPALESPHEPGEAEDLVEALIAAVEVIPAADWRVVEEFDPIPGKNDPEAERAMIGRVQPALDGLDHVWRRGCAAPPPADVGSGPAHGSRDIVRNQKVFQVLSAATRLARDSGAGEAAVRLATDQALVGQDLARQATTTTTLVGVVMEGRAIVTLAELVGAMPLPRAGLDRLAMRLEALRGARPPLDPVWTTERTILEGTLADETQAAILGIETARRSGSLRTWRTLYSHRIARSNALRALETLPERLPEELSREPMEGATARALAACRLSADDPILWDFFVVWPILFHRLRERDARQAVLELAVAIARFEAERGVWPTSEADLVPRYLPAIPTSPMDPGGLRFVGNKAWSRGPDGDDDGGRPLPDPDEWSGDGDIVIEVRGHR